MPIYVGKDTQNKKVKDIFVGMAGNVPVKVIEAWTDMGKIYDGEELVYFVACGSNGALYYSINGVEWEEARPLFDNGPILGVTYGLEKFVAVGSRGMVYYSDDGKLWESKKISEQDLCDIVYSEDKFVTVGNNGVIYWSNDGINWNFVNSFSKKHFRKITYGKGMYIVASGNEYLYCSPDGVNWEKSDSLHCTIHGVAFGNNQFIAVGSAGRTFYSNNGFVWDAGAITNSNDILKEIKYICRGMFITTGKNKTKGVAYTTTNGEQWQAIAGMENTTQLNSITSGPNPTLEFSEHPIMAVMVGNDGVAYWCQGPDSPSTIYQENWQPCQGISTNANFYSIAYRSDGGHFRD